MASYEASPATTTRAVSPTASRTRAAVAASATTRRGVACANIADSSASVLPVLQRYDDQPGAQRPEVAHDERRPVAQRQRDPVAGDKALPQQPGRERGDGGVELAPAHGALAGHQGGVVRTAQRREPDEVGEVAGPAHRVDVRHVPILAQGADAAASADRCDRVTT